MDRERLVQGLMYLAMALFVSGALVSARHRRTVRWAAIGLYGAAVVVVLVWIGVWLAGR
ncbi:MAG TPA: hypothetical protein VHW66_20075 [Stellaceae bacterium]|jgi:hypothetical protein|nr:hypothetical protein [Stellaceae bacterium]